MSRLASGQMLDRYRIDGPLGRGGMGQVYRAYDTRLRRHVALKVISFGGDGTVEETLSEDQCARLVAEARAAAGLKHASVVTIFDVGEVHSAPYIAMELIEGKPLRAYTRTSGDLDRKTRWLYDIASALAAAHHAGLVHRDVKPDNIMVCTDDTVKILDFGVAKVAAEVAATHSSGSVPSVRTGVGQVVGTPRYMAPEQASGLIVDARTDQFAWAVTAYELLTGVHPRDASPGFCPAAEWRDAASSIHDLCPALPPAAAATVMRALERRPEGRFGSMDDLAAALAASVTLPIRGMAQKAPPPSPSSAAPPSTVTSPPTMGRPPLAEPKRRSASRTIFALGFGATLLVGTVVVVGWKWRRNGSSTHGDASVGSVVLLAPDRSVERWPDASASESSSIALHDGGSSTKDAALPTRPRTRIVVSFKPIASSGYANDVIVGLLGARKSAIESCLTDGGDVRAGAHVFAYLDYPANGRGSRFRFDCREVSRAGCLCLGRSFSQAVSLDPPSDGQPGVLSALISIKQ